MPKPVPVSRSAAIRPAGPAPMMAISVLQVLDAEDSNARKEDAGDWDGMGGTYPPGGGIATGDRSS
jgi:hypothetical protein